MPGRGHHVVPSAQAEISYAPQTTSAESTDYHPSNDHVATAISRIDGYEPGCALQVAMLSISSSRSAIIDELVRVRQRLGCPVQVAVSIINTKALTRLMTHGIEVRVQRDTRPGIHSKMMLYRGRYDGASGRTMVWGGSHNWTMFSLRSRDEVFVAIGHPDIYLRYHEYFGRLWGTDAA